MRRWIRQQHTGKLFQLAASNVTFLIAAPSIPPLVVSGGDKTGSGGIRTELRDSTQLNERINGPRKMFLGAPALLHGERRWEESQCPRTCAPTPYTGVYIVDNCGKIVDLIPGKGKAASTRQGRRIGEALTRRHGSLLGRSQAKDALKEIHSRSLHLIKSNLSDQSKRAANLPWIHPRSDSYIRHDTTSWWRWR